MLHVKIDNLNDSLVGFCFIRSIDRVGCHPKALLGYLLELGMICLRLSLGKYTLIVSHASLRIKRIRMCGDLS
jgi:hypothetical protein